MAKGAELAAGGCPDHTIYVWPSRELVAQSWDWPEAWHEAFEQAAYELSGMVATCVLGGLPVTQQPIEMQLSAGWIRFRVACCGTRIDIDIVDFEGPDAPGPGGGTRRPHTADELVLGVRGSGKAFTMVTFYGPLPPIPAGHNSILRRPQISALRICIKRDGSRCLDLTRHPSEHNNNFWASERLDIAPLNRMGGGRGSHNVLVSIQAPVSGDKKKERMNLVARNRLTADAQLRAGAPLFTQDSGADTLRAVFPPHGYRRASEYDQLHLFHTVPFYGSKLGIPAVSKLRRRWNGSRLREGAGQGMRKILLPCACLNPEPPSFLSLPMCGSTPSVHWLDRGKPPSGGPADMRLQ